VHPEGEPDFAQVHERGTCDERRIRLLNDHDRAVVHQDLAKLASFHHLLLHAELGLYHILRSVPSLPWTLQIKLFIARHDRLRIIKHARL